VLPAAARFAAAGGESWGVPQPSGVSSVPAGPGEPGSARGSRGSERKDYLNFPDLDRPGRVGLAMEENVISGVLLLHSIIHIDNLWVRQRKRRLLRLSLVFSQEAQKDAHCASLNDAN